MAGQMDLEDRVRELEWRLDQYHEHLEEALEHDRQFQLNATWGIVSSTTGGGAFIATLWLANKIGLEGWIMGTVAAFAAIIAFALAASWAERGREDDKKKLSRLPKWEKD